MSQAGRLAKEPSEYPGESPFAGIRPGRAPRIMTAKTINP
jgi:hypothetical protein